MNTPQLVPSTPLSATAPTPCEMIWQTLAAAQRDHVGHVLGLLCCELVQQLTLPPRPKPSGANEAAAPGGES